MVENGHKLRWQKNHPTAGLCTRRLGFSPDDLAFHPTTGLFARRLGFAPDHWAFTQHLQRFGNPVIRIFGNPANPMSPERSSVSPRGYCSFLLARCQDFTSAGPPEIRMLGSPRCRRCGTPESGCRKLGFSKNQSFDIWRLPI